VFYDSLNHVFVTDHCTYAIT